MVTVRNITDKPIMVDGKLLWPNETTKTRQTLPGLKVLGKGKPKPKRKYKRRKTKDE